MIIVVLTYAEQGL